MQINKITDASIHFGKALFAATFDLMSVPILTSIYQVATNSDNNNTNTNRERTMQVPKSEDTNRVAKNPPYDNNRMRALTHENTSGYQNLNDENDNNRMRALTHENTSGYPNLNDENNKDENRNDHNVPTSPV